MSPGNITPYKNSTQDKKNQVARMFDNIALRYDFLNHFLSFGIDRYWRRKAISCLKDKKVKIILDIATGTGDLAIEAMKLNPDKVFGVDISLQMLEIGKRKILTKKLSDKIQLMEGDSEDLIFEDNKFDAVTAAFGVRNFGDLELGLHEMRRVLKPGGTVVILEFSQPENSIVRRLYNFYSSMISPKIGSAVSKDKSAYSYLYESAKAFPHGFEFCKILTETGYKNIHFNTLTFGVVTIYTAEK